MVQTNSCPRGAFCAFAHVERKCLNHYFCWYKPYVFCLASTLLMQLTTPIYQVQNPRQAMDFFNLASSVLPLNKQCTVFTWILWASVSFQFSLKKNWALEFTAHSCHQWTCFFYFRPFKIGMGIRVDGAFNSSKYGNYFLVNHRQLSNAGSYCSVH